MHRPKKSKTILFICEYYEWQTHNQLCSMMYCNTIKVGPQDNDNEIQGATGVFTVI